MKYILTFFHKKAEKTLTVDYSTMTIEHLAPQSRIGQNGLTEQIVGQIGNLILVSDPANTKLGNKSFAEKKKVLIDAGFSLPSEIAAAKEWGAKQIIRRTEKLAVEAYNKLWKI